MNIAQNLKVWYKYWCPPLWMKGLIKQTGNVYRSIFERYPLSDQANSLSCDPLFIISAGRSGTTLLRSMLVASGSIAIPPETQIIHNLAIKFNAMQGQGWEGLTKTLIAEFESHHYFKLWSSNLSPVYQTVLHLPKNERSLARLIDEVYKTYADQQFPNALMWGDQSPIHTFYLPYIERIFPDAKYLHLLRDGRDVVASYTQSHGQSYFYEALFKWKESINRVKKLQDKLDYRQFIEIRYESLVNDPELTLQAISQFIGLEYNVKMLDYWKLDSTIESKLFNHHRNLEKPVFSTSIGSWKKRLSKEQKEFLTTNLTNILQKLGYL